MIKSGSLFLLVLIVVRACAQVGSPADLIPRHVLFDLGERKEWIKVAPDASRVYYIKGAFKEIPDNKIYYRNLSEVSKENAIEFDGAIAEYVLIGNDRILSRVINQNGQSFILYDLKSKKFDRLYEEYFRNLKLLAVCQNYEALVFLAIPLDGNPYLAKVDLRSNETDTLKNMAQGHYPLFFDGELNLIAGEIIDPETGEKSLDYWKYNTWHSIVKFERTAERFLRPGLKSILGVNLLGNTIYFTDNSASDRTQLMEFDILSKKLKILVKEQKSDLLVRPVLTSAEKKPLAIANHFAKRYWNIIDESVGADFKFLNANMKDYHILSTTDDLSHWIVEELNGGLNICSIYDRANKALSYLFSDHDALEEYTRVNRYYDTVVSFDSLELPIQYYLSEKFDQDKDGLPDNQMPAVLYVHGGPWQGWMEDNWLINRHLQLLADRGYLVVYSQFRGSLTYGKDFLNAGNKQWGEGMVKDKVAIANWLASEKNILEDKIGIFGWSYGGYAALAGAAFSPETFACAISLYGPTYLDAPQNESAFGYSPNSLLRIADVTSEEGLKLARRHSPLYFANKMDTPILMSTGSRDDRVPQMQMDKMADSLHENGKDVTYFIYPEEGHDYRLKETWTTFWSIAEPFLSEHLGGLYQPPAGEDCSILEYKYIIDDE